MNHIARIVPSCVLRIIPGEWSLLRNETFPICPCLVISLISTKLELLTNRFVNSVSVSPANIGSQSSPEEIAKGATVVKAIGHWALLTVAAVPMSRSSRGGWGRGCRRHVVWRSWY